MLVAERLALQIRVCRMCSLAEKRTLAVPGEMRTFSSVETAAQSTELIPSAPHHTSAETLNVMGLPIERYETNLTAPSAPLIALIAEAPGKDEDKLGRPMMGAAGQLLNQLLLKAGYDQDVLITNQVRCRPPRNRLADAPDALIACQKWTILELQVYDPTVVVLLGATAIRTVFGATAAVGQTRGHVRQTGLKHVYGSRAWIPTYHPAAALHRGGSRGEIEAMIVEDLKLAKDIAYGLD